MSGQNDVRSVKVVIMYSTMNCTAVYVIASVGGLLQYLLVEKVGRYERNE